jgi:glycerol-3-phosphate dehydrogenase
VAEGDTALASRPVVFDHGAAGGPEGLVSVSGVKLTTARAVAEKALAVLSRRGGYPARSAPFAGKAALEGRGV